MPHRALTLALLLLLTTPTLAADPAPLTLAPGDIHRLPANAHYQSSAPRTAQVLKGNILVALQPGVARLTSNDSTEYTIAIEPRQTPTIDPATLKQFPDSRPFEIDGRKCYGSELNGQRATDPAERQFTRANRVINPTPLRPDKPLEWEVRPNTPVLDGAGVQIGTVAASLKVDNRSIPTSKFNFGMSKVLAGRLCLYAFSLPVEPVPDLRKSIDPKELTDGSVGTSAWLPLDQVVDQDTLIDRIGLGKPVLPHLPLEDHRYRVTGGDPHAYDTPHGELAIVKALNGPVPSHYLRRPSGTVNLLYSVPGFGLGGQSLDSFLVSDNLTFRPAKGAKQFTQPTYYPKPHPQSGQVSPKTMTFLYGALEPQNQPLIYGWIARESLAD